MKSILAFALIFTLSQYCFANNSLGIYVWSNSVTIEGCDIQGNTTGSFLLSKPKQKISVFAIVQNYALFRVLDYANEKGGIKTSGDFYTYNFSGDTGDYKTIPDYNRKSRSYGNYQKYFRVPVGVLDSNAYKEEIITSSLAVGALNFPFKIRPQGKSFDFNGAFNFGVAVGWKVKHESWRKYNYNILGGMSVSQINIDTISATRNKDILLSANGYSALSLSLGIMVENQKVQIGAFIGWDWLNRTNQSNFGWAYQGKPWFSIGIGYSIFSSESTKQNESTKQDD